MTEAGFEDQALIDAFNSVVGALEGYITMELAADGAVEGSEWVEGFDAGLNALDTERFPLVKRHLPQMYNRSFVMRWKSGDVAPLADGYNFLIDTLILVLRHRPDIAGTGRLTQPCPPQMGDVRRCQSPCIAHLVCSPVTKAA